MPSSHPLHTPTPGPPTHEILLTLGLRSLAEMAAPFLFEDDALAAADPFFYDIYNCLDLPEASTSSVSSGSNASSRPQTGASLYAEAPDMVSLTSTPSSGGSHQSLSSPKTPTAQTGFVDPFASPLSVHSQHEGQSLFAAYQDSFLAAQHSAGSSAKTAYPAPQGAASSPLALAPAAPIYSHNPRTNTIKGPFDLRVSTSYHPGLSQPTAATSSKVRRTLSAAEHHGGPHDHVPQPASAPHWQTSFSQAHSTPSRARDAAPLYSNATRRDTDGNPIPPRPLSAMAYHTPQPPPRLYVSTAAATEPDSYRPPMSAPAWQTTFEIPKYCAPPATPVFQQKTSPYLQAPHTVATGSMPYLAPYSYSAATQHYLNPLPEQQKYYNFSQSAPPARPRSAPAMNDDVPPPTPTRPSKAKKASTSTPKSRAKASTKASAGSGSNFVNFTSADASKLLTGVAPSGSSKRKREEEEEAAQAAAECDSSPSRSKRVAGPSSKRRSGST